MNCTVETDAKFGDNFVDISKTDKRFIRATVKTYDNTGTYVFLKLLKPHCETQEFVVQEKISLSVGVV